MQLVYDPFIAVRQLVTADGGEVEIEYIDMLAQEQRLQIMQIMENQLHSAAFVASCSGSKGALTTPAWTRLKVDNVDGEGLQSVSRAARDFLLVMENVTVMDSCLPSNCNPFCRFT